MLNLDFFECLTFAQMILFKGGCLGIYAQVCAHECRFCRGQERCIESGITGGYEPLDGAGN